jgi:hypothetical protein
LRSTNCWWWSTTPARSKVQVQPKGKKYLLLHFFKPCILFLGRARLFYAPDRLKGHKDLNRKQEKEQEKNKLKR